METYNRNNIFHLLMICFACLMSACNSNIDLEPKGIITADGFFASPEDFEKALNGVYTRINTGSCYQWLDATTDDALVTHSWNAGYQLGRGIANSTSPFPANKWSQNYVAIQRANNIINNIDTYKWPDEASDITRNKILGEARTLRAFFYLDQVCLFGRIMFYEINPATVLESENIPQIEDPKIVFDFILKELEEAIIGLPEKSENKSKIGQAAARLLRARAAAYAAGYLNDKSYFKITLAETAELLKSAPKLGDYDSLFKLGNENIEEVILVKSYSPDARHRWGDWYNNSIGGYCVTTPVKALVDAYEYIIPKNPTMPYVGKDPRFYSTIYAPGMLLRDKYYNTIPDNTVEKDGKIYFDPSKDYGALQEYEVSYGDVLGEPGGGEWNKTTTGFTYKKYNSEPDTWFTYNSYIVFRFAEAYLLRAEALVETGGNESEVKSLLKILRDRAGNTNDIDEVLKTNYNNNLLNMVRNERRIELAQEGLRLFDIRRWKILLDVMNKPIEGIEYRDFSGTTPIWKKYIPAERESLTARDYWWPIPQSEIDLNKGRITQNKDW